MHERAGVLQRVPIAPLKLFSTSRMFTSRRRSPRFAGGIIGSINAHSASGNTKPRDGAHVTGRGPSTSPFLNRERAEHGSVRVNRFGSELCQILSSRNAFWRASRKRRAWPPNVVTLSSPPHFGTKKPPNSAARPRYRFIARNRLELPVHDLGL